MEAERGCERLRIRVNDDLVLDAGACEDVVGPDGPQRLICPPEITLFHQVLAHLRAKPDPPARASGSSASREGVAAAALVLRRGSYLAVLLDRDKPLWPAARATGTSRIRRGYGTEIQFAGRERRRPSVNRRGHS